MTKKHPKIYYESYDAAYEQITNNNADQATRLFESFNTILVQKCNEIIKGRKNEDILNLVEGILNFTNDLLAEAQCLIIQQETEAYKQSIAAHQTLSKAYHIVDKYEESHSALQKIPTHLWEAVGHSRARVDYFTYMAKDLNRANFYFDGFRYHLKRLHKKFRNEREKREHEAKLKAIRERST